MLCSNEWQVEGIDGRDQRWIFLFQLGSQHSPSSNCFPQHVLNSTSHYPISFVINSTFVIYTSYNYLLWFQLWASLQPINMTISPTNWECLNSFKYFKWLSLYKILNVVYKFNWTHLCLKINQRTKFFTFSQFFDLVGFLIGGCLIASPPGSSGLFVLLKALEACVNHLERFQRM